MPRGGALRNTWQAAHAYLTLPPPYTTRTYTAHTYQFPSSPFPGLAHWTDIKVSALGSRVGWTPARNNEWTNDLLAMAQSCSYDIAIHYVLSVLWMWSCFHIMERMGQYQSAYVSSSLLGGGIWGEVCRFRLHLVVNWIKLWKILCMAWKYLLNSKDIIKSYSEM